MKHKKLSSEELRKKDGDFKALMSSKINARKRVDTSKHIDLPIAALEILTQNPSDVLSADSTAPDDVFLQEEHKRAFKRKRREVFDSFYKNESRRKFVIEQLVEIENLWSDLLRQFFEGTPPEIDNLDLEELRLVANINPLFRYESSHVSEDQLDLALERATFLKSLHNFSGGRFTGRVNELQMLAFYVKHGYLENSRSQRYRPLLIRALGGMGKSTLLGHYLRTHICSEQPPKLPFAFLDFDRRVLSIEYPATLLNDALRQLAFFYPAHRKTLLSLRKSWRSRLRVDSRSFRGKSQMEFTKSAELSSARATEDFVDEFGRILHGTGIIKDRPLLLIFDTFEEVQGRSRDYVAEVGRFLDQLHHVLGLETGLRVILSGRVDIEESSFLTHEHVLGALDKPASEAFLHSLGVHPLLTPKVVEQVKGIPLTLRLASDLIQKSQDELLANAELASLHPVWYELADDQIQGMIYRRYLDQIHDENVKKLAHPGLVLRVVTPALIEHVLQKPCGIKLANSAEDLEEVTNQPTLLTAQKVFDDLANEVSLVSRDVGNVLKHRPEVRRAMLELLNKDRPSTVRRIHQLAVKYYKNLGDSASVSQRAEEIYHRLQLRQSESTIRKRWRSGVELELGDCLDELPHESQLILAAQLGRDDALESASTDEFENLDKVSWELYAIRKAKTSIKFNTPHEGLDVLSERQERLPGSELYVLEPTLHKLDSNWGRMRDVALAGMESAASVGNQKMANELAGLLVQSFQLQGDFTGAESAIRTARDLVEEGNSRESLSFHLQLDLAELEILRLAANESDFQIEERAVGRLKRLLAFKQLSEFSDICQRAAGSLGRSYPEIVRLVLQQFPIDASKLNEPKISSLTTALTLWDELISLKHNKAPGLLAKSNRLEESNEVSSSQALDWQNLSKANTQKLANVVLAMFPDSVHLDAFLRTELSVEISSIVSNNQSLNTRIFQVIGHFQRSGSLNEFIRALKNRSEFVDLEKLESALASNLPKPSSWWGGIRNFFSSLQLQKANENSRLHDIWELAVRRLADGKRTGLTKTLQKSAVDHELPSKAAIRFAVFFAIPDETEALAPAYLRLVETLDESQLEELSQRVLGLDVLEKGDKAKSILKNAYDRGMFQKVLDTARELGKRTAIHTRQVNEHKTKYIDVAGGEGSDWRALHKALLDAFPTLSDVAELVRNLNREIGDYIGRDESDLAAAIDTIIQEFNAAFEIDNLVLTAIRQRPYNGFLKGFAIKRGILSEFEATASNLTTVGDSIERMLNRDRGFTNPLDLINRMQLIANAVCRIEVAHQHIGTGFLIASNLVLTTSHLIAPLFNSGFDRTNSTKFLFDYNTINSDGSINATEHRLDLDWLFAHSFHSTELVNMSKNLDFAIVRLATDASEDPVGETTKKRGHLTIPAEGPNYRNVFARDSGVFLFQHAQGKPLAVSMSSFAEFQLVDEQSRVKYQVPTELGTSGSPCFDSHLELIALHQGKDFEDDFNFGLPIDCVRESLREFGKWEQLV